MLEAIDVSRHFGKRGGVEALSHIDFQLHAGRIFAIVGESGSGKSTLARILCGLDKPDSGEVRLDGSPISRRGKDSRISAALAVQLMMQDGKSSLDPRLTVYKSVAEALENLTSLERGEIRERVMALFERMELPPDAALKRPGELSGGQLKRVCFARVLAVNPKYIILDETFSGPDGLLGKSMLDLLLSLRKERGCGVLLITHELDAALYAADEIAIMKDGKIIERRDSKDGPGAFTHPYTRSLLRASHIGTD